MFNIHVYFIVMAWRMPQSVFSLDPENACLAALEMCVVYSFGSEKVPFFKSRVQPILLFLNA
jgi:hypothetical protein